MNLNFNSSKLWSTGYSRITSRYAILTFLFFLAYYFYTWIVIEPALYYSWQQPVFYFGASFFNEFLNFPGGLGEYAGAFLSQLYYIPWLGALVITLIGWSLSIFTGLIFKAVSKTSLKPGRHPIVLHLIPAVLLIILHSQYLHLLSNSLGLLVALVSANLYVRCCSKIIPAKNWLRTVLFLVMSIFLYYSIAGQFFLFASLCILFELLNFKKSWFYRLEMGLFYLIITLLLPFIAAKYLFVINLEDAFTYLLPFTHEYKPVFTPYLLYAYFPCVLLGIALFHHLVIPKLSSADESSKISPFQKYFLRANFWRKAPGFTIKILCLLLFSAVLLFYAFDANTKTVLKVDNYAQQQNWKQVLKTGSKLKHNLVNFQVNRALFHTGRLLFDFFSYPQNFEVASLILSEKSIYNLPLHNSDLFYELGHINEAQHWAYEAESIIGDTPAIFQRLFKTHLLKNEFQDARACLLKLQQTLHYQDWAAAQWKYLNNPSHIKKAPQFKTVSSRDVKSDFITYPGPLPVDLELLVRDNPHNQMAFEYLMAAYLLTNQLDKFIGKLELINNFRYPELPRHVEEALIVHFDRHNFSLKNPLLRPETVQKFKEFKRIIVKHRGKKEPALADLKQKFGNTFWFYIWDKSPVAKKRKQVDY